LLLLYGIGLLVVLVGMRGRNDDTGLLRAFWCIILAEVLISNAIAHGQGFLAHRDDLSGTFADLRDAHIVLLGSRR